MPSFCGEGEVSQQFSNDIAQARWIGIASLVFSCSAESQLTFNLPTSDPRKRLQLAEMFRRR